MEKRHDISEGGVSENNFKKNWTFFALNLLGMHWGILEAWACSGMFWQE